MQCDFGPRTPNSQAHEKAGDFLFTTLSSTTSFCRRQRFEYYDSLDNVTLKLTNIIASYNPKADRRILLCAHWDSRPRSENDPDTNKHNLPVLGANDGASGVAVLLELGRVFKNKAPPLGVDIVLFDGEDYGRNDRQAGWFLGSDYFARNLGSYRPRLAILLDMVGDSHLQIYREAFSEKYAGQVNDYIWMIAREAAAIAFIDSVNHTVADDHLSLLAHGVKAIDIIDFDYPYWHTQEDTPDKCSSQSLAVVGNVILAAVFDKRMRKL
jgi:Zn-dependent M28 family amino/carboxypeptidase